MENSLFGVPYLDAYLVIGILGFFILLEILAGYWESTKRTARDWIQELGAFLVLTIITKPLLVILIFYLGHTFFANVQNSLSHLSIWISLPIYLLIDDFLQYWYHRFAHSNSFLWKLHRPHHQAEEMGFFVSYRNAALYYFLMPNIWWIGIMTFLGGATGVALGIVLKQIVIVSSHSTIQYDKILYKNKFLSPIAFLIERIFITPAFHHAHHGKSQLDGVSDPNGNFGNMFSIWDQLFGTAAFNRAFPTEYGLPNDPKEPWTATYLHPLVYSNNPDSELSKSFTKTKTSSNGPLIVHLEKGKKYLWCKCGLSKNQPFCDGSHHGTKFSPQLFEAKRSMEARLCNCKRSKKSPFCDDSHLQVES